MQLANNPLFIEDLSAEANQITRGLTAKRRIIVKNLGDKKADIDIWIAATDEKSEPLLRWCTFSEQNPLKLNPKENREVILNFEIPQQATPDFYNYEILIEASAQYPDKFFRRPQQLRVVLSGQDTELGNEPIFTLQPVTNSAKPYPLPAGEKLEIKVKVENRSKRVDRFYLTCPELTKDWFIVHYPESRLETSGLVKETDGLELNPGGTGEITLLLYPPQYTLAGNYFPTIRLISSNKEDLVLLDVVYLQILTDETLNAELHPLSLKIPSQPGVFEVKLLNQGNIKRDIAIFARDQEQLFTYHSEFTLIQLSPGDIVPVTLKVKPSKWWRRPFRGKGLEFNFNLELENNKQLLLPELAKPPALPKEFPQGTLLWEARPWWQFWLPLVLLILLLLGVISVAGFLMWQQFFIKPKINEVATTKIVYQEGEREPINLNFVIRDWRTWRFKNWQPDSVYKLQKVTIISTSRDGLSELNSYNINELLSKKYCQLPLKENLICTVPTKTIKAGEYTFELKVFTLKQNTPTDSKKTDTITIKSVPPIPVPKIIEFSSAKPVYEEALKEQVVLNWEIRNQTQIKTLNLVQQGSDGLPIKKTFIRCNSQELNTKNFNTQLKAGYINTQNKPDTLSCQGVPTNLTKAGNYTFKLEVFSKQAEKNPSDSKETDTITIKPVPPVPVPKIDLLLPSKSIYEANEPVFLSWKLNNPSQIKEVRIIQNGSDGSLVKNSFDIRKCQLQTSQSAMSGSQKPDSSKVELAKQPDVLICKIPLTPPKAGSYTFKLDVFSKQDDKNPSDSKETDTITIKPVPPLPVPKIDQLLPGKSIYEAKEPVFLSWKLTNPSQIKEVRIVQQGSDGSVVKKTVDMKKCNPQKSPLEAVRQKINSGGITNNPNLLICQNIRVTPAKAGSYTYKLEVFYKQDDKNPFYSKETDTITIKPEPLVPVPKIVQFDSTQPFYEEAKNEEIFLNWEISDASQVKELRLIGLALDGSISSPLKSYPIINNTLPDQLKSFCNLTTTNLICKNVTTNARQAGDYIFKLTVITKQGEQNNEVTKNTATVKIKPVPPKSATPINIIYFRVNGQDVNQKQKHVIPINKARGSVNVILSWKVEDGEDIKVELLLSSVNTQGNIPYLLSKPPSSQTIMLKVTNKAGEQQTRSVTIETVEASGESQPQISPSGDISPEVPSSSPSNREQLSPIEIPPQPD